MQHKSYSHTNIEDDPFSHSAGRNIIGFVSSIIFYDKL